MVVNDFIFGREFKPYADPADRPKNVALIDEQACIGCTLCIQVCPTDAIIGSDKQMHTVVSHYCTGCELCLPPCPVDCIALVEEPRTQQKWRWKYPEKAADQARARLEFRSSRLEREETEKAARLAAKIAKTRASLCAG